MSVGGTFNWRSPFSFIANNVEERLDLSSLILSYILISKNFFLKKKKKKKHLQVLKTCMREGKDQVNLEQSRKPRKLEKE